MHNIKKINAALIE